MHKLLMLLLFAAVSCQTAPVNDLPPASEPAAPAFRVLEKGVYPEAAAAEFDPQSEARVFVARDAASFERLWRKHIRDGTPPPVDFNSETAVILLLGQKRSGGWAVHPKDVQLEGRTLAVAAQIDQPERGSVVTMAITAPYAVLAVKARDVQQAVWRRADGSMVARDTPTPAQ